MPVILTAYRYYLQDDLIVNAFILQRGQSSCTEERGAARGGREVVRRHGGLGDETHFAAGSAGQVGDTGTEAGDEQKQETGRGKPGGAVYDEAGSGGAAARRTRRREGSMD